MDAKTPAAAPAAKGAGKSARDQGKATVEIQETEPDVVVINMGSGYIKVGWAGEDKPRGIFPAIVIDTPPSDMAASNQVNMTGGDMQTETAEDLVGYAALREHQQSTLKSDSVNAVFPIMRGEVSPSTNDDGQKTCWMAIEKIWAHCFKNVLRVDPSTVSVVVTVPPICSTDYRSQIASRLFKSFKVMSVCLVNSAVMCLFATGRTTGIVLETGEGVSFAVPIVEGFSLKHAIFRSDLAGRDVTRYFMRLLSEKGINFGEQLVDVVRDMKERLCVVRGTPPEHKIKPEFQIALTSLGQTKEEEDNLVYELPDGKVIRVDEVVRYHIPEILFNPSLLPGAAPDLRSLPRLLVDSMAMCDEVLAKDLAKNIILAGGNTVLRGFSDRVRKELQLLHKEPEYINVVADSQRKNAAWIGASMFASLPTFSLIKVTKKEYAADPEVIFKKRV